MPTRLQHAYLLLCLAAAWPAWLRAQLLTYDVYWGKDKVGAMTVERRMQGGEEWLVSKAEVKLNMVFEVDLRFEFENVFVGGRLHRSVTSNYRNGARRNHSFGQLRGDAYEVNNDGEVSQTRPADIRYTVLRTYFAPPGDGQVFSERWGRYVPFVYEAGHNRYTIHLPSGDKNHYYYQNGVCTEIVVNHTLSTLHFRLRS
ncbi:MAG: hypothetical protein OHK0039_48940 [Bacteroidia bacterium]